MMGMFVRVLLVFFISGICISADELDKNLKSELIIGLDADMSAGAALGGEAIYRGATLAINEINLAGGVNGKRLKLLVKDHRGIPARGIDNILEFADLKNLIAVIGGVHTPVALAELEAIHKNKIIYLDPWAAGTPIIENNYNPNYAFRVSVRDEHAGGFLVKEIVKRGYSRPSLFLERTGWGRSNKKAIEKALGDRGLSSAHTAWFYWGIKSFNRLIDESIEKGSDSVILVANPREGVQFVKDIAAYSNKKSFPIISHWGITGGDFFSEVKNYLETVDLTFIQTYSFLSPSFPKKNSEFVRSYFKTFLPNESKIRAERITAPVGTAHAYDLVHLLAIAIRKAKSNKREDVREALESIKTYKGLLKQYNPPFSQDNHDALDENDFRFCYYDSDGAIKPVK